MVRKIMAAALAAAMLFSFAACKKSEEETTQPMPEETTAVQPAAPRPVPSADRNPLTGVSGYDESLAGRKMTGIVVENSPDARPQWGMSSPDVIMEYEVEGGITRMLWLYADESRVPSKVGPVRSARHDPVELAIGYDMLFVHCGGSNFALDLISATPALSQIEGLTYSGCFERDQTRNVSSEHRYCLLGDKLRASIDELKLDMTADPAKAYPFLFTDESTPRQLAGGTCTDIKISYSTSYNFDFSYDAAAGLYACSLNGTPRTDDAGKQCAYSNVIVLYTDMIDMGTSSGHQDLLLENGGRGVYVNGGNYEDITWAKPTANDPLRLYSADGSELTLNCGNSYVGFVRSTQEAKTTF